MNVQRDVYSVIAQFVQNKDNAIPLTEAVYYYYAESIDLNLFLFRKITSLKIYFIDFFHNPYLCCIYSDIIRASTIINTI